MIDAPHNGIGKPGSWLSRVAKLCRAPFYVGLLGAAVVCIGMGSPHAIAFAKGALLVTGALLLSAGFYLRSAALSPGLMIFRLFVALAIKWAVVIGGTVLVLAGGGVAAGAFVAGLVAGLIATLFGFGLQGLDGR